MEIKYLVDHPEHIETVGMWVFKEFIEGIQGGITAQQMIDGFKQTHQEKFPITLIALVNGICAGAVSLVHNDLKQRMDLTPWLAALYVPEEFRNRGIAKTLCDESLKILFKMNYATAYLRTEHTSELYVKWGWTLEFKTIDEFNMETEVFSLKLLEV